jgi:hypothetical protein
MGLKTAVNTGTNRWEMASVTATGPIDNESVQCCNIRGQPCQPTAKFLTWIEPSDGREFLATFVAAAMALRRELATHRCACRDEARRWVEARAVRVFGSSNGWTALLRPRVRHAPYAAASPATVSVKVSSSTISQPWDAV